MTYRIFLYIILLNSHPFLSLPFNHQLFGLFHQFFPNIITLLFQHFMSHQHFVVGEEVVEQIVWTGKKEKFWKKSGNLVFTSIRRSHPHCWLAMPTSSLFLALRVD